MTHIREGIFTMSCFQVFTTEERVTQEKIPGKFFFKNPTWMGPNISGL